MKIFVRHFDASAQTSGKTKCELINNLPPFEERYDKEMLHVSRGNESVHDGDDDSEDAMDDDTYEHIDVDDHNVTKDHDDNGALDRANNIMYINYD